MLQLKNIRKAYTTGDFTQVALDDVSLSLRDNEFVAILGPSGSGKTTLLNIVGGLDKYDSGDLVVDGISTKEYKDRDWDTYRNNRVGFVFQSYNLIPHQTVLANVELALTLSGVGREERERRATEALKQVGLGDHINKKPAQLSGGQMQRVAIARALINDPEIVLADEPTGALDSKTSVQIMDLLTEIAKDRLVVMVTHNPELAEEYATRIVNLSDGQIVSDTQPYNPTPEELARISKKPIRRTKMSFLTALGLSFNNLMTKKGRTIMTAFAGSIGIIGIASILALANGVNAYIASVEEETLSSYPLQITSQGFDITSMMVSSADVVQGASEKGSSSSSSSQAVENTKVGEANIMNRMFDSVGSNDLASLKEYLDSGQSDINKYTKDIQYRYNVTPYIYTTKTDGAAQQINPDDTFTSVGLGSSMSSSAMMSTMMSTDVFNELKGTLDMAKESYDLKAGHWPEKYNECVLVLTKSGQVSDFLLYVVGLRDRQVMTDMVKAFMNDEKVITEIDDGKSFTYKDFLDLKFKMICTADLYQYDSDYKVWVDKSDDAAYLQNLVANGDDIVISGIVQPNKDTTMMTAGIYYTSDLTQHLIEKSGQTQIVKDQLANPQVDVFNGKTFAEEADNKKTEFDMESMFSIDGDALANAIKVDSSKLQVDTSALSNSMSPSDFPPFPEVEPGIDQAKFTEGMSNLLQGYFVWMQKNPGKTFEDYLNDPTSGGQELMTKMMEGAIDPTPIQAAVTSYVQTVVNTMTAKTQAAVGKMMQQLTQNMSTAMSMDENAFRNAFKINMDQDKIQELVLAMMSNTKATFDGNLAKLDYAQLNKPYEIDIFPKNFEDKQKVIDILDAYNNRMNSTGQENKAITYTDIVGALMTSVTTIIDMISYVLVAFVSISLIVSSIMIGVITYISVLERKKEIGILRAIGASKSNISQVFNAETVIEGLIAGVLGVGITALGCIPASAIVYKLFDVPNIAQLPPMAGLVLVAISVVLTFVAGLIPASSASRKDPVEALRSE